MTEQLQLDTDGNTAVPDHFTVSLHKGELHGEEFVRSNKAYNRDDAEEFIEAFRTSCHIRDGVVWDGAVVNRNGHLNGLAPGGVSFVISVTPPLNTALAPS